MKGFRLQVLGYSLLFFLLFTVTCPLSTTFAADSTPSADIKAKLDELKREIASKAAKLKQEINKKLLNKAYVGKVKTISTTTFSLGTGTGPKIVTINQDTIFESNVKLKQKFSRKILAEENYIAALGDIDEGGVLTAKKVILLPSAGWRTKTYLWGQLISRSDSLATVKNKDLKNIAVSLSLADIKDDLKINEFIIMTGQFNKNEIFEAEFVYVIPQGGILKPKKIVHPAPTGAGATPSATLRPNPSATPKPTVR